MAEYGIHTIDTAFQRAHFDAAYLIVNEGRGAFVDCGTNHSIPNMLAALDQAGLAPEAVDFLMLTHVHLDHAGGAGALMTRLPNARLVVHPRGAPHMIDPSRLIAGATAVYGEKEMARSYGEIIAVPEHRVLVAEDGHTVDLAGRPLLCIDTPGHARHHYCIWDAQSRSWFSGDTFGLSYRELDSDRGAFVMPTTSPVQFDPDALKSSIARLLTFEPQAMYLTHYDQVTGVPRLAADLFEQIDAMVAVARACSAQATSERHRCIVDALTSMCLARARAHGCRPDEAGVLEVLGMDIELNAQGLGVWLDREQR